MIKLTYVMCIIFKEYATQSLEILHQIAITVKPFCFVYYKKAFLYIPGSKVTRVEATVVPCTQISMTFFDRLYSEGVVRENGYIVKCYDDYYDDILIADELRKVSIARNIVIFHTLLATVTTHL